MQTIYKYLLRDSVTTLALPKGAQVLTVQVQNNTPVMWVKQDPAQPTVERTFRIYGTGQTFQDEMMAYVATFQTGPYVLHVFEVFS